MRALRLSGFLLALTQLVVSGGGSAAQTTNRYPASGTPPYPNPYATQPSPYTVQPLSDADLLASEMRLLAADPNNLQALVRAGELALKLDDDTAAAALFARAERIDPHNGRAKAGEASLLVAAERPGEALRRFAEAQSYGVDARSFAADRGLAYDLVGEQDRAQRDYRLALTAGANDETQRRYALSLGISGKRALALAQIDPLLRKSDRGAWRARAFILAMGGDKAGAEKIATSMMPTGMAQGLQPFFEILPGLRPADRAFAVHFGEVRATSARLADARLVPPLPALTYDPAAPVEIAPVVAKPVVVADARKERKSRRKRDQLAVLTTPPPQPLPPPPAYRGQSSAAPVVLAVNAVPMPPTSAFVTAQPTPAPRSAVTPPPVALSPSMQRAAPASSPVLAARPVIVASASPAVIRITTPTTKGAPTASAPAMPDTSITASVATLSPPLGEGVATRTVPPPPLTVVAPTAAPIAATPSLPPPAPTPVRSEESILAAIIADIKVPGAELQAAPTVTKLPFRPAANVAAVPAQTLPDQATVDRKAEDKKVAEKKALADKKLLSDAQALADKKAATDTKVLADKKAVADRKAADAKKVADAKKAEEKRKNDPKLLEPSRVWVQVAGGANERDLPKQWAKVRAQSTKLFGGKGGWTTPLRATNRILTGPFKTESEAQSFVNTIAKDGISGFVFVSEAGQKITKLTAK